MGAKFLLGSFVFYLDTLKNFFSKTNNPIYTNFGLEGPWVLTRKICVQRSHPLSTMAARGSDWLRQFRLVLKNHCMDCHQTFHNWSSSGPEEVLLFFAVIGFPRWPPWTLTDWDIFDLFSRTTAGTITKHSINVPFIALQKFHCFLMRSKIPRRLPSWEIFNIFSRTTVWVNTKPAKNVPFIVPRKCCYYLLRTKIQDGSHGLWLAETIFNFFSWISTWRITKFSTKVPIVILKIRDIKNSKVVTMDSDWLRHFGLLLKNHIMDDHHLNLPQLFL